MSIKILDRGVDPDLVPANIKAGVNIDGVIGAMADINSDPDFKASNIKKGVDIVGVVGTAPTFFNDWRDFLNFNQPQATQVIPLAIVSDGVWCKESSTGVLKKMDRATGKTVLFSVGMPSTYRPQHYRNDNEVLCYNTSSPTGIMLCNKSGTITKSANLTKPLYDSMHGGCAITSDRVYALDNGQFIEIMDKNLTKLEEVVLKSGYSGFGWMRVSEDETEIFGTYSTDLHRYHIATKVHSVCNMPMSLLFV